MPNPSEHPQAPFLDDSRRKLFRLAGVCAALAVACIGLLLVLVGCSVPTEDSTGNPAKNTAAAKPTAKATPKKWITLTTAKGSGIKQFDTIKTSGGRVKLVYDFTGDQIFASVYLMVEGKDLNTDGGVPDVMVTEAGKGETILRKDAGSYYLNVSAANSKYTVTVQEEK